MFVELLVAGGGGAVIGGIVTKVVEYILSRETRRVDSAQAVTDMTIDVLRAVAAMNNELQTQIAQLRQAIIVLTDAVDEILPHVTGLSEEQRTRLQEANNAAEMSV